MYRDKIIEFQTKKMWIGDKTGLVRPGYIL